MLAVSLVFGSFLTILFLVVGLIGGWTAREYMMNYREVPRPHPEMFDNQGNLIPDEVMHSILKTIMTTAKKTTTRAKKPAAPKKAATPLPDLPNNPFIYEVFDVISKQRTKARKIEALQKSRHLYSSLFLMEL